MDNEEEGFWEKIEENADPNKWWVWGQFMKEFLFRNGNQVQQRAPLTCGQNLIVQVKIHLFK